MGLIIGGPFALACVLLLWLVIGGDSPPPPASEDEPRGSAAPAATAAPASEERRPPAPTPERTEQGKPDRPAKPAPQQAVDVEGEETEAEVKARLEAVDRARQAESQWIKDLESRTADEEPTGD